MYRYRVDLKMGTPVFTNFDSINFSRNRQISTESA